MMKRILACSKWIHKYIGLLLILFLVWMSISGILINHPSLIAGIDMPLFLTPQQYHYQNWNRSSLIELQYLNHNPEIAIACGKAGVWISIDGGKTFSAYNDGLPESGYYRKTADIFIREGDKTVIYAGTKKGLYQRELHDKQWTQIPLPVENAEIKKILFFKNKLHVFSTSNVFSADFPAETLIFKHQPLNRDEPLKKISLVDLFFELHSGAIWGLPGKLLFDLAGVILFFLSISAFYSWYYPWKRKKQRPFGIQSSGRVRRMFKWFFKYHLKLGIWAAFVLFVFGATGFFMRPPLLAILIGDGIPKEFYPGIVHKNPWHDKINNVLYDISKDKIIIEAKDGLWQGDPDFNSDFKKIDLNVPVFVMGTTVFENADSSSYLAGSFNGLYLFDKNTGSSFDLINEKIAKDVSSVRPADLMVTGYFKTPAGESFISTHEKGIIPLGDSNINNRFIMPEQLAETGLPLWNWFFEIHNGRFFKDWIGGLYILIIPLGSLLYMLIILSGVIDWLYIKVWKKTTKGKTKMNKLDSRAEVV